MLESKNVSASIYFKLNLFILVGTYVVLMENHTLEIKIITIYHNQLRECDTWK